MSLFTTEKDLHQQNNDVEKKPAEAEEQKSPTINITTTEFITTDIYDPTSKKTPFTFAKSVYKVLSQVHP